MLLSLDMLCIGAKKPVAHSPPALGHSYKPIVVPPITVRVGAKNLIANSLPVHAKAYMTMLMSRDTVHIDAKKLVAILPSREQATWIGID